MGGSKGSGDESDRDFSIDLSDAYNAVTDISNVFRRHLEPWNPLSSSLNSLLGFDPHAVEAYPVPSLKQYTHCVDNGGKSVWTEDGVWRCLFKGSKPPGNLKMEFLDYTKFLEYQRDLVSKSVNSPESFNDIVDPTRRFEPYKYISKADAKGKSVVGQSTATEAFTVDDGKTEVRKKTVKYYDDGTASVETSTDSSAQSPDSFW